MTYTKVLNEIKLIDKRIQSIQKNNIERARFKNINYGNSIKKLTKDKIAISYKHFVGNIIDQYINDAIYIKENIVGKTVIVIQWTEIFGWGDRMFAYKTCKIINNYINCDIIIIIIY